MGPCPSTGFRGRLDPKEDLNILPDPVVHPVDADRGRQCRIDLEDRGDGFLAFLNIGDLMRERIDDYALPFGAALDVLDLKTNVWVGDNDLGLFALGRVDVYVGLNECVVDRYYVRNIVLTATKVSKILLRDHVVDLVEVHFLDLKQAHFYFPTTAGTS